jgi:hypothetical protein
MHHRDVCLSDTDDARKAYFDEETDGGRNQAAVGGTNVSLDYPPDVS